MKNKPFANYVFLILFTSSGLFFNQLFVKTSFGNTFRISNSLDTDLAQHFVGTDLDPNVLQRLQADQTIGKELRFEIACGLFEAVQPMIR